MKDWYGKDWRQLRTELVKLCLHHSDDLLSTIEKDNIRHIHTFIEKLMKDIWNRTVHDTIGLWEQALPLLSHRDDFVGWLLDDINALTGNKTHQGKTLGPRQALARKLNQYFENARRSLLADELDVNPSMLKTWERLDRISRQLAKQTGISNRCNDEHFAEVSEQVRSAHANDRNLPRKLSTIQNYFFKFCADCHQELADPEPVLERISTHDIDDNILGHGMAALAKCLDRLSESEKQLIDVEYGLGIAQIRYRTHEDYCRAHSVDETEFNNLFRTISTVLQDCLELSLGLDIAGVST